MVLSGALQWWEDWQLRVLVLSSLGAQCYLAFFASARKKHIRPLFRFSIWLAYLGGDAVAIYALATLFNRQRKLRYTSGNGSHGLEVLWAPILLWHLGGQINISAYSIEDNELWSRHVLTAVSQVTVALYVFCKSWASSAVDERLLVAAILLFILGSFKCFNKPLALKRASFNTIVTTFFAVPRREPTKAEVELEAYIQQARDFVRLNQDPISLESDDKKQCLEQISIPDKLFVDYAYVYHDRLTTKLRSFWLLDKQTAYKALRAGLSVTFDLIYSKMFFQGYDLKNRNMPFCADFCSFLIWFLNLLLPIVPIGLFHASHKQAYRGSDIRVTIVLLYVTYFLEILSVFSLGTFYEQWSDWVAQQSLVGLLLARNRKHTRLLGIVGCLQSKGLLDTCFGIKPCQSAEDIIMLVYDHVKAGWMSHITDTESYWRFSDTRGYWALERNGCDDETLGLGGSIDNKPFDESVILWHVATEFCFYRDGTSDDSECSRLCRQISNYMMHLLFANPEMLLPGSRRNLFNVAYGELENIIEGEDLSLMDERGLTLTIFNKAESANGDFIQDSWVLAQNLRRLDDNNKMWEVIKSVWIEMLCFSAGRCRGYLHAKSLGSGGEYLSFVSLLMSHAGLETFAERQQRVQLRLPKEERVRIAKQIIQEAANNQATGGSSTPQGTVPVKEEEIAGAIPSPSPVTGPLKQEEDAASTLASRDECVAPAPAIEIVVSP